jgi:hypothetical protein
MISYLLHDILEMISALLPKIGAIAIVLILGFIIGKLVGKAITVVMNRLDVDRVISNSGLGKTLKEANLTLSSLIGTLARWFIYLIALLTIADIMQVVALSNFLEMVVGYIPYLISGLLIIGLGFLFADFISKAIANSLRGIGFIHVEIVNFFVRLFVYLIVVLTSLSVMKIDITIINTFASAMAWGLSAGIALAMGLGLGLGLKDVIAKNAESFLKSVGFATSKLSQEMKTKDLESEIKRLESELNALKLEKMKELEEKKARVEALSKPVENIEEFLNKVVGSSGKVTRVYGGYQIMILDPIVFPWADVTITMQNLGYDVWISKKDNMHFVVCKLKAE